MALGNLGDVAAVGDGVSELRLHYGPGYRVYFIRRGDELFILLCGGDKSTQAKDIKAAKALATDLEEDQMAVKTKPFDPAAYLENDEGIAAYLESAMESADAAIIADALGVIARARGMAGIAKQTGLSRESLYKALSAEGNPEFSTVLRVVQALGLRISVTPNP